MCYSRYATLRAEQQTDLTFNYWESARRLHKSSTRSFVQLDEDQKSMLRVYIYKGDGWKMVSDVSQILNSWTEGGGKIPLMSCA